MRKTLLPLFSLLVLASSCTETTTTNNVKSDSASAGARPQITLVDAPASPDFPDAKLSLASATAAAVGDSVKVSFAFNVSGYELKKQTDDAPGKPCNNSDKGQHIHFILDNKPYVALYEPKHEATLAKGTEHTVVCFLSRSYHESVKTPGASLMYHFRIDEKGSMQKMENDKAPMLVYSRPKGDYLGKDTANILLDFYPFNAEIGGDYKVQAKVSNETTGMSKTFVIDKWEAFFLQNLGTGNITVDLALMDKDGNVLEGPMMHITRKIRLAAAEPMP